MKTFIHKFIVISLFIIILASSPKLLLAQQKLLGELSITKNSSAGFVTVNDERVISGRSIASPSLILTSPQASAKVSLAKTGTVYLSPNSKLNLSFINSSISMDIFSGEIVVETVPNTSLNLSPPDGNVTLPIQNQANIIKVKVVNGKTQVQALVGKAQFNTVLVSAGETYPLTFDNDVRPNKSLEKEDNGSNNSKGFNPLLIVGLLGAVAAIALVALSSSSGNDNPPVVSPTR
jgi:hypothetical protein